MMARSSGGEQRLKSGNMLYRREVCGEGCTRRAVLRGTRDGVTFCIRHLHCLPGYAEEGYTFIGRSKNDWPHVWVAALHGYLKLGEIRNEAPNS